MVGMLMKILVQLNLVFVPLSNYFVKAESNFINCDYYSIDVEFRNGGSDEGINKQYCEIDDVMYEIENEMKDITSKTSIESLSSGKVSFSILENMINENKVIINEESLFEISSLANFQKNSTVGERDVIVIRIIAGDAETKRTKAELRSSIFGDRGMKSQFSACSINQLNFNAFNGETSTGATVENGIGEVTIAENIAGLDHKIVEDLVRKAVKTKYGALKQFDHVMFCFPYGATFGSDPEWIAYAYSNNFLSVYNDDACSSLSVQMHEIAHNLDLDHSGRDGNSYGDLSCMLGAVRETESPRICFNGAKSWELGWYTEAQQSVDPREGDAQLTLIGITDYEKRGEENLVLIQLIGHNDGNSYFISFNRKTGFNSGTTVGANRVIITYSKASGGEQSWILAILNSGEQHTIPRYGGGSDVVIYVAEISTRSSPATAQIVIGALPCSSDKDCTSNNLCTTGTCNSESSTCEFKESRRCIFCIDVKMEILPDNKPEESRLELVHFNTGDIFALGPFTDADNNAFNYTLEECLDIGNYKFTVFDSQLNGLCCENGRGSFELSVNGFLVKEGGEFLYSDETFFSLCREDADCDDGNTCTTDRCDVERGLCIFDTCLDCGIMVSMSLTTDNFPAETTWNVKNIDSNEVLMSGGPYSDDHSGRRSKPTRTSRRSLFSQYSISTRQRREEARVRTGSNLALSQTYTSTQCLGFGNYILSVEDSYGDGICCTDGRTGSFTLSTPITQITTGGEFASRIQVSFALCTEDSQCNDLNDCTIDTCNVETQQCNFETRICSECGELITVTILTDLRPEESSWTISQVDDNKIFASRDNYDATNTQFTDSVCLPVGSYNFTILDSFQNGLCCESGNGNYQLTSSTTTINQGSQFTASEETLFSICFSDADCIATNACSSGTCDTISKLCTFSVKECSDCGATFDLKLTTDVFPEDTRWTLENTITNEAVLTGGPYTEANSTINEGLCLEASSYKFTVLDAFGDGLSSSYSLSIAGVIFKDGGNFISSFEETSFIVCLADNDCDDQNSCTSNHCESNRCVFRDVTCSDCGSNITVSVLTDSFPNETRWEIVSTLSNSKVLTGGNFETGETFFNESKCLEVGEYIFSIFDSEEDGFIEGGLFLLQSNNEIFAEGGSDFLPELGALGFVEQVHFAVCLSDADCDDNRNCTIDICDFETNLCMFVQQPCEECGANVTVELFTDLFPEDNTWKIEHSVTQIKYLSGGPYIENLTKNTESLCLDFGTYIFTIDDIFGDGITTGNYSILVEDIIIKQNGTFGFQEQFEFTLCSSDLDCDDNNACSIDTCDASVCKYEELSCEECGKNVAVSFSTFNFRFNATWAIENIENNAVVFNGGPYLDPFKTLEVSKCLGGGLYKLNVAKTGSDDVCCLQTNGTFEIKLDDEIVFQGGDEGASEEFFFEVEGVNTLTPTQAVSLKIPTSFPTFGDEPEQTFVSSVQSSFSSGSKSGTSSNIPTTTPTLVTAPPTTNPTTSTCPSKHIKKCDKKCTGKKKNAACRNDCDFPIKKNCSPTCPSEHEQKCDDFCTGSDNNKSCKKDCNFPVKKSCRICPNSHVKKCEEFCQGKKNFNSCKYDCDFKVQKKCNSKT